MKTCSRNHEAALLTEKDEEIIGVLTAISVVSRQLAAKLARLSEKERKRQEGGRPYGENERTCGCRF